MFRARASSDKEKKGEGLAARLRAKERRKEKKRWKACCEDQRGTGISRPHGGGEEKKKRPREQNAETLPTRSRRKIEDLARDVDASRIKGRARRMRCQVPARGKKGIRRGNKNAHIPACDRENQTRGEEMLAIKRATKTGPSNLGKRRKKAESRSGPYHARASLETQRGNAANI